jgi:hypothetical protein
MSDTLGTLVRAERLYNQSYPPDILRSATSTTEAEPTEIETLVAEGTVEDVKAYVIAHPASLVEVLDAEEHGKNRVTLLNWLDDVQESSDVEDAPDYTHVEDAPEPEPQPEPQEPQPQPEPQEPQPEPEP